MDRVGVGCHLVLNHHRCVAGIFKQASSFATEECHLLRDGHAVIATVAASNMQTASCSALVAHAETHPASVEQAKKSFLGYLGDSLQLFGCEPNALGLTVNV